MKVNGCLALLSELMMVELFSPFAVWPCCRPLSVQIIVQVQVRTRILGSLALGKLYSRVQTPEDRRAQHDQFEDHKSTVQKET